MMVMAAIVSALLATASPHPGAGQDTPAASAAGPTVQQFHAAPLPSTDGSAVVAGPIQSQGPFAYWYNLPRGVAVGFINCRTDGHCARWLMFTVLPTLDEQQHTQLSGTLYGHDSADFNLTTACDAFGFNYETKMGRVGEINPDAMTLYRIGRDIDASYSPSTVHDAWKSFADCAEGLRALATQ